MPQLKKTIGIMIVSLFCLSMIPSIAGFTPIIVDSNLNFNVKEGDTLGFLFNQTNYEYDGNPYLPQIDETIEYTRVRISELTDWENTLMGRGKTIGVTFQTIPYSPLQPDFTSGALWEDDESKTFFVNNTLTSFFELSRMFIPNDLTAKDYFSNASNFVITIMSYLSDTNPLDDVRSQLNTTEVDTELTSVNYTNNDLSGKLWCQFDIQGTKIMSELVSVLINTTMEVTMDFRCNQKRITEFLAFKSVINMTGRLNTTNELVSFMDMTNSMIGQLLYDSRPFTFWDYNGMTVLIGVIIVTGGVIGFFAFYGSKCKSNPAYSKVCQIYRKPLPKDKSQSY